MATDWRERLTSPDLFPLALDPATDEVGFVSLAPVDYEKASFLDARLGLPVSALLPFAQVEAAMAGAPVACDFIFHVGHVGSTLVSRLLGTHPAIFSLREPQALRTFAQADAAGRPWEAAELDRRLLVFQALYSRSWAAPKRALIKATSMVCELGPRLMALSPGARALLMTVAPETYLATILGSENIRDVEAAAPGRLARLCRRLGAGPWTLPALSPGELAALSWAADMAALTEAARSHPGRTAWIDFDAFLADPAAGVAAALAHLHGHADPQAAARIAASPYLQRYSKAPEYAYGPQLRRDVLAEARRTAASEISRGLAWLERAAADWPAVGHALQTY